LGELRWSVHLYLAQNHDKPWWLCLSFLPVVDFSANANSRVVYTRMVARSLWECSFLFHCVVRFVPQFPGAVGKESQHRVLQEVHRAPCGRAFMYLLSSLVGSTLHLFLSYRGRIPPLRTAVSASGTRDVHGLKGSTTCAICLLCDSWPAGLGPQAGAQSDMIWDAHMTSVFHVTYMAIKG